MLTLNQFTDSLISVYSQKVSEPVTGPLLSVSQTVSFAAFIYEKMRNAIEYREDHLIRRAAIERILRRRFILHDNGRGVGEALIKEMLWARYLPNNSVPEDKIGEIQKTIDKYLYLRQEVTVGRPLKDQRSISNWILEILSCEIEEKLVSSFKRENFINFVFQFFRQQIKIPTLSEMDKDVIIYIAVHRAFARSDNSLIRYNLFKLAFPNFYDSTWKDVPEIISQFMETYQKIEGHLNHPLGDKVRRVIKKQMPPFLILRDIFEAYSEKIKTILIGEKELWTRVDEICRKIYQQTGTKLRRGGMRSIIYIFLTKMIFALLIEYPFDKFLGQGVTIFPLIVNSIFPPLLMTGVVFSIKIPGEENTRRIYKRIKSMITLAPGKEQHVIIKKERVKRPLLLFGFTLFYLIAFILSFGSIIFILSELKFNIVSQIIFLFFLTVVSFFGFRIRLLAMEYLFVEREKLLTPIADFFALPILSVGKWLSKEIGRLNVFLFVFDFVFEAPFKAFVEIGEEWIKFVRAKKEEII